MLPPHLTRHLYETRRLIAEGEGRQMPPWYRLTPEQRADAEMDMEVFRRAILSAEEEQDLVTAYNSSTSEPQETAPPLENCSCPGCSTVAALLELLKCLRRLEDSPRAQVAANVFPFNLSEVTATGPGRTPSAEDIASVRTRVQKGLEEWVAAGKPLKEVGLTSGPAGLHSAWDA